MVYRAVVLVCWLVCAAVSFARASDIPDDAHVASLVQKYRETSLAQRADEVRTMLKIRTVHGDVAFYKLIAEGLTIREQAAFELAVRESGSCNLLLHFGSVFARDRMQAGEEATRIAGNAKIEAELTEDQRRRIKGLEDRLQNHLETFGAKTIIAHSRMFMPLVRQQQDCLAAELLRALRNQDTLNIVASRLALYLIAEEGFEALLEAAKTKDDELAVFMLVPAFGEHAVIPTLKYYENPQTSETKRNFAGTLILSFSAEPPVADKVVEAFRHGRYFRSPQKKVLSLKDALSEASSWWGHLVKSHYHKKPELRHKFAEYVARTHLTNPNGQGDIITLVLEVDLPTALPYVKKLDFNALSDQALGLLYLMASVPKVPMFGEDANENLAERFDLFKTIFMRLNPSRRQSTDMIYSLDDYPARWQGEFLTATFSELTVDEKQTAIFLASKLPTTMRDAFYETVRSQCDQKLRESIDYYQGGRYRGGL